MAEADHEEIVNLERLHAERTEKKEKHKKKKKSDVFHLDDMQFPGIIMNIGKCGRGKSHLTRYLLNYYTCRKPVFTGGIVFCGSINSDYDFLPPKYVFEGYDENKLKNWIAHLKGKKKELGDGMPHNFVVFDDLLGILQNSAFFMNFVSTYRHTNTTIFVNNQYLASAASGTQLRELTTYLFAFQTSTHRTIKCLYEWYGADYGSLKEFKEMFADRTKEPNSAMLYLDKEEDVKKKFLYFKAPDFTPTKITY